ncbi:MAG TPA: APC family permease [Gryllotalpicola sp.]
MSAPVAQRARKGLPLWAILALSLSIVGPTLAMSGNGQGLVLSVGKGVPLVLILGLICVALVAYGFVRLTRHMSHSGSAYALVGRTVGPRSGFFSGFAMIATYLGFATGCVGLFASFFNSFLAAAQGNPAHPFQLPWIVPALIAVAAAVGLTFIDAKRALTVLLWIEGVGIVAMLVLTFVIFARGGAAGVRDGAPGIDWSVFTLGHGVSASSVLGGIVVAFLTWAGFEGCATLGEESDDPTRAIPRVLIGSVAITGVLFTLIMFAETVGFGTDAKGLAAFGASGNTLGELGSSFVGNWFGLIIIFTGLMSSFACVIASAATSGRLVQAFARDGFLPQRLAKIDERTEAPRNAILAIIAVALVINVVSFLTRWPNNGGGADDNLAIDAYGLYATAGAITLMIAYLMVEIAAIWFVNAKKFAGVTQLKGRVAGTILPAIGAIAIVVVLVFNVKGTVGDDGVSWSSPVYIGLAWCLVGLVIAAAASRLTARIGEELARSIDLGEGIHTRGPVSEAVDILEHAEARLEAAHESEDA